MKNSRKQIIAQIELMDRILQSQQNAVIEHQEYFDESSETIDNLKAWTLLITAFFAGWTIERMQMGNKIMHQIVDIGKLALLNSVKNTAISLFNNNGRSN